MPATYDKTMRTQYPCVRCGAIILVGTSNNLNTTACDRCVGVRSHAPSVPGEGMKWPASYMREVDALNRHSTQQEEA